MTPRPPGNALLPELAAGKPPAFAALYDRLSEPLLRVACAMLRDPSDAEDALQDLFVNLARSRHRFLAVEDLDAYVFACLRHAVGSRLATRKRQRQQLQEAASRLRGDAGQVQLPPADPQEDLTAALDALPAEQREIVAMKIDGGLTFSQIAIALNIRPTTAASRYRYAMEKLRRWLEEKA